jgi:ABC-2 type transport system permease protein
MTVDILLHILRYKFISFVKATFDLKSVSIVRGIGSLLVFAGFSVGAFYLARGSTEFVVRQMRAGLFLFHQFLSMLLFIFFVTVNLGNIIVSYATLYRSSEVGYLLTKPVSYTSVFILKFLDNFLYSSTTLFLVAFMVICGYGSFFHYPWYFYPFVMLAVLVPFMFLSASIAVLILMAIMKLASRIGFRKVMGLLFLIYFGMVFFYFNSFNPIGLVEQVNRNPGALETTFAGLEPGFLKYLPNQWVSSFLYDLASGALWSGLGYVALLVSVTAGVFLVALFVARKFYYRSWLVSLQVQAASSVPYTSDVKRWFDFRSNSMLAPQTEALLKKEYFQFIREPSQWIHFLVMVMLTSIFVFAVGNLNLRLRVTEVQLVTYLVLISFGGFLTSSIALRFVFPMVSMEGKSFWLLLSSPIERSKIYRVKFILGLGGVIVLAMVVAVATNIPFVRLSASRPLLMYSGVFTAFWISLTMVAMNLGFGGFFANYAEKNPIRIASSQGATLTFLATLLYLIATVTVLILPLNSYFQFIFVFEEFDPATIVIPGTIIAMLSTALIGFSFAFGMNSLRRDF